MKYRTKVSIGLVALALATNSGLLAWTYYQAVRNLFRLRKGDLLQVKGKADSIQVFSVEGPTKPLRAVDAVQPGWLSRGPAPSAS